MILVCGSGIKTEPNTHKMKGKRRRHDPEFKARVALEALKGVKTIQQIAKDFDIHPVQVSDWKKAMAQAPANASVNVAWHGFSWVSHFASLQGARPPQ